MSRDLSLNVEDTDYVVLVRLRPHLNAVTCAKKCRGHFHEIVACSGPIPSDGTGEDVSHPEFFANLGERLVGVCVTLDALSPDQPQSRNSPEATRYLLCHSVDELRIVGLAKILEGEHCERLGSVGHSRGGDRIFVFVPVPARRSERQQHDRQTYRHEKSAPFGFVGGAPLYGADVWCRCPTRRNGCLELGQHFTRGLRAVRR